MMIFNSYTFSKGSIKLVLFLISVISIFSFTNLIYLKEASIKYIMADIWRFIEDNYIYMYFNGLSFENLLHQKSHTAPWFQLFEYSSIYLYDFLQIYDIYIGFVFRLLSVLLVCFYLIKVLKLTKKIDLLLFTVPVVAIYMNIVATQMYDWNQVSLRSVTEFFIIVLMVSVDSLVRHKSSPSKMSIAILVVLIFFNIFIMTYDITIISIVAISFSLIISIKSINYKLSLKIILIFFIALSFHKIFYLFFVDDIELTKKAASLSFQIKFILEYIHHFSVTLMGGLLNISLFKSQFYVFENIITVVSPIFLFIILGTSFTYLYKKYPGYTLLPLMFVGYSLLFALALSFFRWSPESSLVVVQPRNSIFLILGMVGLYIQIYIIFKHNQKFLFSIALLSVLIYIFHAWSAYYRIPYVKEYVDRNSFMLYIAGEDENSYILPRTIVGKNEQYKNALVFLKENRLNVYSPSYRHSRLTLYYKENKKAYNSLKENVDLKKLDVYHKNQKIAIKSHKDAIIKIKIISDYFDGEGFQTNIKDFKRVNIAEGIQYFYLKITSNKAIQIVLTKGTQFEIIGAKKVIDD